MVKLYMLNCCRENSKFTLLLTGFNWCHHLSCQQRFHNGFFHAPFPEAAAGGAGDVEASEEVVAAGGGAEVLEADARLFKT